MKPTIVILVSLVLLIPASLQAQPRGPIVAVFEMEDKGSGLAAEVLGKLTDYLGVLLTKGGYRVVPRTEIRDRLKVQKQETYKSCYDQSCQIELGREMAAEKTLATWILKIGKTCQVTATLYDLKKGTTEQAAAHEAACDEENLLVAVKAISDDLCKGLDIRGASAEEAAIKAAVAKKEAEAAREEARRKAVELEKMRREAEAAKKRAEEAEAERLKAQKKVAELEKSRLTADSKELEQVRLEARQAKERAEKERKLAEAARLEAEKKADEARREAEEARKHPEGRPTESYNVGVSLLGVFPDVTDMTLDHHEQGERTGTHAGGLGITIDADFMLASFLSLGAHFGYVQGEFHDPSEPSGEEEYNTMHLISAFASLKGRLNLDWIEFRPGIAGGYQHLNGSLAGKVHGLGLAAFVEIAFYLGRHFALTTEFCLNIMPLGAGNEGDQTYTTPLLIFSLGAEYCD